MSKRYSAKPCSTSASARCSRLTIQRSAGRKLDRHALLVQAGVLALGVHQHEARRVPQLVAEVAVALAAAEVEVERAREARERGEGEAQRIGAEGRDAVREMRLHVASRRVSLCSACIRPCGRLLEQLVERDAVDQVERVEGVALRLRHLLALGVAHDGVDVDVAERHLAGEVQRRHDHARDPEEDDVEAGDQHRRRAGTSSRSGVSSGQPSERERHQRRGEPGVEHVRVAPQRSLPSLSAGLRLPLRAT